MTLLVGDIGGTNARFALLTQQNGRLQLIHEMALASQRFPSLEDALATFLDQFPAAKDSRAACLGIAGPVRKNRCETTNLPWVVDGDALAPVLKLESLPLLNDLEAAAWGLSYLNLNGVRTLREGAPGAVGNRALIAAGTGLGEAALFWDGHDHHPFATEGGHADFGPANEQQVELWRFLRSQYAHVSWERIVSGPGLISLFQFILQQHGRKEPSWFRAELAEGDAAAAITQRAHDEGCPSCRETLDLFFCLLGAETGNLALRTLATGGIYLAGGIIPKLLPELMASKFLPCFTAKGRFQPLLEAIPVRVVVDDRLGLWGAAARAMKQTQTTAAVAPS